MPGLTAFFFAPPSQSGPPSPLLADNIDPRTRDFADLFTGADPVDAQLQVAVSTTLGSGPCVADTGIRITRNKMTDDFPTTITNDVRQALARQVKARDIQIVGITIGEPDGLTGKATGVVNEAAQSVQVNVQYRNLRALDPRVRSQPIAVKQQG